MEEGAFDNLPGQGQPLDLDDNPFLDPEWQLAYHLLKENGYAPDFIERRQVIELGLAQARETLARAWGWRQRALAAGEEPGWVQSQWRTAQARFEEEVDKLNQQIRDYNLSVPSARFSRTKIDSNRELSTIKAN